jgi:hypothetical protein
MRKVLLLVVVVAGAPGGCAGHRAATAPAVAAAAPAPDAFRAEIAPLLAKRCAPCHNPGGKMYDRLPFDDPATVAGHPEGILKRIKDPAEHALIERWIAEQSKS